MINKLILLASLITMILFGSCSRNNRTDLYLESDILASSKKIEGEFSVPSQVIERNNFDHLSASKFSGENESALAIRGIYIPKYIKKRIGKKKHSIDSSNSLRDIPGIYIPSYVLSKVKENQQQKALNLALIKN